MRAVSYHDTILDLREPLTVRAVFERAWHVHDTEDRVLTVTTAPYDGPLALRVSGPLPVMRLNARGSIHDMTVYLGRLVIPLDRAAVWTGEQPSAACLAPGALRTNLKTLRAATRYPYDHQRSPWRRRAWEQTAALCEALIRGEAGRASEAAVGLLGLGPGLTPAGDDIIVGLLAGLCVLGMPGGHPQLDVLTQRVEDGARTRTTSLSRTLLHWSARGVAAQPLLDVLWNLGCTSGVKGLDALLTIGHTSGRDMLEGVALAASVILGWEETGGLAMAGAPEHVSRLREADARVGGAE